VFLTLCRVGIPSDLTSPEAKEPVVAVFLQQVDDTCQFLSINGKTTHHKLNSVSFAIPGCIDPALIERLIPYCPTSIHDTKTAKGSIIIPRELSRPVLDTLARLGKESEDLYRHNAAVLDNAYARLADQTRPRMMTLTQIAKTLLMPKNPNWTPPDAALLAVRKALHHNRYRIRPDTRNHRLTNVFAIRPKDDVKVVETVHQWVREFEEHRACQVQQSAHGAINTSMGAAHIVSFIEKARRLVAITRKHRHEAFNFLGPSKIRPPQGRRTTAIHTEWGEDFSSADKLIISFLQSWVLTNQFADMSGLHSSCATILHATGCYDHMVRPELIGEAWGDPWFRLDREVGMLFLQEIGVITPYENRVVYNEHLMLPTVRLSRNMEILHSKAELTRRNPDFRDSMDGLRKDWGTMEVYCIDDEGAKEIDDGISISSVPGSSSEYWVHVHVANPTAFFDKSHVLSGLAAHMTESVYMPERAFSMLPSWVTQDYFSLSRNRPVLTFSTRVDLSGAVLERKIQPGIVRRTTSITPRQLADIFGEPEKPSVRLIVGGQPRPTNAKRDRPELSPNQLQDLKDLYTVAKALFAARQAAGGVKIGIQNGSATVYEKPGESGLTWTPPSVDRARIIHGDPIIQYTSTKSTGTIETSIDSQNIVEEMMILACTAAGVWCSERNIPVMYRGTVESPYTTNTLDEFREKVVKPYMEKHGRLSLVLGFEYLKAMGRSISHSSSLPHRIIGVPSYVKVTSPLRRFSDMVAHWQIEAALRYEMQTGKKFDLDNTSSAAVPRPSLPFSRKQMQESIVTFSGREKIIKDAKNKAQQHWTALAFWRALYFKEAELPTAFRVWIRKVDPCGSFAQGILSDYGIRVLVRMRGAELRAGDEWEAKLAEVTVFQPEFFMEPVSLLRRDDAIV
jgi:hypothetical protein